MNIIFLNGASGAGKTSICKALQDMLPTAYLHIGIDQFIEMMPDKLNDFTGESPQDGFYWKSVTLDDGSPAFKITAGEYGKKINDAYRQSAANLAGMGLSLIIDDITNGNEELQFWKILLKPYNVIYVGVYCDVDILQMREKQRGDRKIGTAIEQNQRVHRDIDYDFCVDSTNMSAQQCAQKIISELINSD